MNYASTDLLSHQVSPCDIDGWIYFNILKCLMFPKVAIWFSFIENSVFVNKQRLSNNTKKDIQKRLLECLSLSFHLSLLPRHALTTAHTGHLCWPANQRRHCHPLLVPLHAGGLCMARSGSSHCM